MYQENPLLRELCEKLRQNCLTASELLPHLDAGLDITDVNCSILSSACANRNIECVELLLNHPQSGPQIKMSKSLVEHQTWVNLSLGGSAKLMEIFLFATNPNHRINFTACNFQTAITYCATSGQVEILDLFFSHPELRERSLRYLNQQRIDSIFFTAVCYNYFDLMHFCLHSPKLPFHANPRYKNDSALCQAVRKKYYKIANHLLFSPDILNPCDIQSLNSKDNTISENINTYFKNICANNEVDIFNYVMFECHFKPDEEHIQWMRNVVDGKTFINYNSIESIKKLLMVVDVTIHTKEKNGQIKSEIKKV